MLVAVGELGGSRGVAHASVFGMTLAAALLGAVLAPRGAAVERVALAK
jgi:hypothetical protein